MASLVHHWGGVHSAPTSALGASRDSHTQLCACQTPVPSAVALSRLSPGRHHKQRQEDGDARVARGNGRLTRTSLSGSVLPSQLAFGSYGGKARGSESPGSQSSPVPHVSGRALGPSIPGLGV